MSQEKPKAIDVHTVVFVEDKFSHLGIHCGHCYHELYDADIVLEGSPIMLKGEYSLDFTLYQCPRCETFVEVLYNVC